MPPKLNLVGRRLRRVRRMVGLFKARLPELDLEAVADPRAREGCWSLSQILGATLVGLMAGCKSLGKPKTSRRAWPPMRRQLGLPSRLPDTTVRDALCRVSIDELRAALHRLRATIDVRPACSNVASKRYSG